MVNNTVSLVHNTLKLRVIVDYAFSVEVYIQIQRRIQGCYIQLVDPRLYRIKMNLR